MNCESFQENLFEYLDDTLPPDEKAAAQSHLQICSACRHAVENEGLVAQTLSQRLNEAVQAVTLTAQAQRSIADAIRKQTESASESKKIVLFPVWLRLAIPAAAAAMVLVSAIWLGRGRISQTDSQRNSFSSSDSAGVEIPVHVSYSAPIYTFHQEGAMVVDALVSDTRVEDGALLANK